MATAELAVAMPAVLLVLALALSPAAPPSTRSAASMRRGSLSG